ncbi:MAG: PHB depolymerase family esterase [Pseudomonadota bacterium]
MDRGRLAGGHPELSRIATRLTRLSAILGAVFTAGAAQAVCGPLEDRVCEIASGTYHIELPESPVGAPALMFLHGAGSSGQSVLGLRGMVETARARGYAVLAPDGVTREGRNGRGWNFHPLRPPSRDEIAFLTAVRDDAAARFGIDGDAVILGGFSIGGSMTAYVACSAPDAFAAYAPLAGNVWRPHPESCAGPVRMLHVHGWTDGTVPLEGRILRGVGSGIDPNEPGVFAQGDVFQALELWRMTNACTHNARSFRRTETYWLRSWQDCSPGAELTFALFDGGHSVPRGWADLVLDWAEDGAR